jgi:hypothetical protein
MRRVCRVCGAPRATVYFRRQVHPEPRRRGPKPLIPDAVLLPLIREDLATSPFREEGQGSVETNRHCRLSNKFFIRPVGTCPVGDVQICVAPAKPVLFAAGNDIPQ